MAPWQPVKDVTRHVEKREFKGRGTTHLRAFWKLVLVCGHFVFKPNDGGDPPLRVRCNDCRADAENR